MNLEQVRALDPKRVIVLDTETTGLNANGNDEILSLSIIDLDGTVLFDELVRPEHRKRWPKAQEVNGISPDMVKDKKTLAEYGDQLRELWGRIDLVVGYNVSFDMGFLYASGLGLTPHVEEFDVMREFASMGDSRWVKLVECAAHYGITDFDAHSSLGDTEATRKCFLALINDPAYVGIAEKGAKTKPAPTVRASQASAVGRTKTAAKTTKRGFDVVGIALTLAVCFNVFGMIVCLFADSQNRTFSVMFYLVLAAVFYGLRYLWRKRKASRG